jgi:VanZ family protein
MDRIKNIIRYIAVFQDEEECFGMKNCLFLCLQTGLMEVRILRLIQWFKPYAGYFLIVYVIAVITVSSIPSIPSLKIRTSGTEIRLDYLIHFFEYGILAFFTFLYFADINFQMTARKYLLITTGLIIFAILDEYHQKLIPGRSFNYSDMLSNISGIIAALIFSIMIFRRITR